MNSLNIYYPLIASVQYSAHTLWLLRTAGTPNTHVTFFKTLLLIDPVLNCNPSGSAITVLQTQIFYIYPLTTRPLFKKLLFLILPVHYCNTPYQRPNIVAVKGLKKQMSKKHSGVNLFCIQLKSIKLYVKFSF